MGYLHQRYGSVDNLLHTAYTDPVGLAADVATVLSAGAGGLGIAAKGAELGGLADTADALANAGRLAGKASELTNPLTPLAKGAGALVNPAKSAITAGVSRLAGFNRATPAEIIANPDFFTSENIANVTRENLSKQVAEAFASKESDLNEATAQYAPIVSDTANTVKVPKNWLEAQLRDIAKVDVKDGEIIPTTRTTIRTSQLSGLQDILDQFKPAFQKGSLSNEEFLNLRRQLDQVAYGSNGIKDSKVAGVAARIRGQLNTDFRSQVKGLEEKDNQTSSQLEDIQKLRKGFFDKQGNLTANAESKIANAANATKATREGSDIARLEQLVPGITEKIKALKAIENIRSAKDLKVGTYDRSILETGGIIGGAATGNLAVVAGSFAAMILGNPDIAVRVIKAVNQVDPRIGTLIMARLARYATVGAVSSKVTGQGQTTSQEPQQSTPPTGSSQPSGQEPQQSAVSQSQESTL